MKVNPYTSISYEEIIEEIPTTVTVLKQVKKTVRTEKKVYEVELNQEQLDLIVAITGNVVGGGPVRKITDSIWNGLEEYATRRVYPDGEVSLYKQNKFSTYFKPMNQYGNLVTRTENDPDEDEE